MNHRFSLSLCLGTVIFALALYFGPLAVMAACIRLGWHA